MANTEIPIKKLTGDIVMTVKLTRQFRFRMWLGIQLIRLASKIFGSHFRLEVTD